MIDDGAKSSNSMLATVLKLEKELAKMKIALGVEGVKTPKKARKAKDPSAPKKEPNVWIKFTQRVGLLLKTTDHKGPATIGKQFASHLKDIKAYDEWTDAEILHHFSSWTAPEQSKMEALGKGKKAKAARAAASVDGSVSSPEGEVAEKKPRKESQRRRRQPPRPSAPQLPLPRRLLQPLRLPLRLQQRLLLLRLLLPSSPRQSRPQPPTPWSSCRTSASSPTPTRHMAAMRAAMSSMAMGTSWGTGLARRLSPVQRPRTGTR